MTARYKPKYLMEAHEPASLPKPDDIPELVVLGNPRLAERSAPVDRERISSSQFQERLELLHWAMIAYRGMGIAAPQIGWWERFFVMVLPKEETQGEGPAEVAYWINPEIVEYSRAQNWCWEGCLSVPGLRGWVRRSAAILVSGLNRHGEPVRRELTGWWARSFQHEYDHLEGMLFPYRLQAPHHLVLDDELDDRARWPADWPAPGARDQPFGVPLPES